MENNENDNEKRAKTKWSNGGNFLNKIPKLLKYIIILIVLLAGIYLGKNTNLSFWSQTKSTKFGLEDMGELVTQTCYLTVIRDTKVNKEFFNLFEIPFTESRQIFSYDVEVDASVNFSEISYKEKENNEITVMLPHAKIYKSTLNLFSFKSYLDSESWFSRIDLEKQNEALKAIEEQAVNDAKANGIIEAADKNAQTLINGFIKSNRKYKDYKITYEYIGG